MKFINKNNLLIDIDKNREELFNNFYFENNFVKYDSLLSKKFPLFEKLPKINLNFISKRK